MQNRQAIPTDRQDSSIFNFFVPQFDFDFLLFFKYGCHFETIWRMKLGNEHGADFEMSCTMAQS